jgi:hypothetical protein
LKYLLCLCETAAPCLRCPRIKRQGWRALGNKRLAGLKRRNFHHFLGPARTLLSDFYGGSQHQADPLGTSGPLVPPTKRSACWHFSQIPPRRSTLQCSDLSLRHQKAMDPPVQSSLQDSSPKTWPLPSTLMLGIASFAIAHLAYTALKRAWEYRVSSHLHTRLGNRFANFHARLIPSMAARMVANCHQSFRRGGPGN